MKDGYYWVKLKKDADDEWQPGLRDCGVWFLIDCDYSFEDDEMDVGPAIHGKPE